MPYISIRLMALSLSAVIFLVALDPSAINSTYMLPVVAGGGIGVYLKLSTNKANNSHGDSTEPDSTGE